MRALRYGDENRDYLWITDLGPTMVMHPFFSDLEGTLLDKYADSEGKLLFIEAVEIAKKDGQGYISYMWPKQDNITEPVEKLSYVSLFKPWSWVIGSGIYLDDVQAEIQAVTFRLLTISLWIGGIVFLILLFIIRRGWKSQKDRYLFQTELKRSRERYQALAHASSEMIFLTINGLIAGVNQKACELLGFKEEEMITKSFSEFVSDANALSQLSKAANEEGPHPVETVIKGKHGPERVLLSVEHAIVNELPAIMYAGHSLVLKELPAINFISHTNINQNGFGIIKLENTLSGKIISADNTAVELLESSNNKILAGKPLKNFIDAADVSRLLLQIQETKQAKNMILRFTFSNGNKGYLQANASIIIDDPSQEIDDAGGGEKILLFISDVTELQTSQRLTEDILSECLAPERTVSLKSNDDLEKFNEEEIRESFIRDKILLRQSVKIGSAPGKISLAASQSINRVFQYAIKKAIQELGVPPCKYALLAYGSIGRIEPTLNIDQDTAILFESTANDTFNRDYFRSFGQLVTDSCAKAGIPPCNSGNTAANPEWCKSDLEWKMQFSHWINASQPEDLILVNIFFDFSMISGDEILVRSLRQHIFDEVEKKPSFLFNLAQDTLSFRSPSDLLGHIRSDSKQGNYVNIKGTMLHFVNFARIYSLKHSISETNTAKRLQVLTKMNYIPSDTGKDAMEAWELLFEMRLKNQLASSELNFPQENTLMLEELSSFNEASLTKAINHVSNLQKRITTDLGIRGL